jgi:hypothetical protein
VKCVGTKSNRTAIGTRVYCTTSDGHRRMDEVRSGGSYFSQSDLRLHFGLGQSEKASLEIHWPSGLVEKLEGVAANQILRVVEGSLSRGAAR